MVQFQIEVINVSQPKFTKTANGGYNAIEVAYKRDGKTDGKKLVDFDAKEMPGGKAVYDLFRSLKEGDVVEVEAQKGEKYWQWVGAKASGSNGAVAQGDSETQGDTESTNSDTGSKPRGRPVGSTTGRVAGSNYETPQERALRREADRVRQYYIVRQSSVGAALEFLKVAGYDGPVDGDLTTNKVIDIAKKFEEYVFGPVPAATKTDSDIPF